MQNKKGARRLPKEDANNCAFAVKSSGLGLSPGQDVTPH